ncbi:MAG: tetratricopeptide repeat protein [Cyclobacteriaceae bacterium]
MKKQILAGMFTLVAMLFTSAGFAQPGWNWCDPVDKTKEKNALFSDNVKAANYEGAKEPLDFLLENCPKMHVSLYQNGVKVYNGLADVTEDKTLKAQYHDKSLELYDKRIEYFGSEDKVLNRKAYDAYKFWKGRRDKYPDLLALFDRTYELNGNKVYDNNLAAYMDVVRRYKLAGNELSDEEILNRYTTLTDIIDFKVEKAGASTSKVNRLMKNLDAIDKMLIQVVDLNCEKVTEIFGEKLKETRDIKLAKKIFKLMLAGKCTSDPVAVEAATIIGEAEPNAAIYKFLAQKASAEDDYEKAIELYEKSAELSDDNLKKAELYVSVGKIMALKGRKSTSRDFARKALSSDPSNSDAYKLIGDLYMNSFEDCKKGVSKVEDRAIFIAAYNMYKRAGSTTGMVNAKAQFPSIDEIFSEGYKEGQQLSTGCWINETVNLERRPSN